MAVLQKVSAKAITRNMGRSGGDRKKMQRSAEGKQALVENNLEYRKERWTTWTPAEATRQMLKDAPGASAEFARRLPGFVTECKRMFPGLTYGDLRQKAARGFNTVW